MSLLYGDTRNALKHRAEFLNPLEIDYRKLVCAKQIHGNFIRYVQEYDRGSGALSYDTALVDTDAFITNKSNVPLAIFTADCLPIFLYDMYNHAIGLIHAGWRGSRNNIVTKAVTLMQEKFNTATLYLHAFFGPAIRDCCYEVGEEFNGFFEEGIKKRDDRYYLDLMGINKNELLVLGVKEENMVDSKICTSCRNDDYFSYRKERKDCGRMMSVMMLK